MAPETPPCGSSGSLPNRLHHSRPRLPGCRSPQLGSITLWDSCLGLRGWEWPVEPRLSLQPLSWHWGIAEPLQAPKPWLRGRGLGVGQENSALRALSSVEASLENWGSSKKPRQGRGLQGEMPGNRLACWEARREFSVMDGTSGAHVTLQRVAQMQPFASTSLQPRAGWEGEEGRRPLWLGVLLGREAAWLSIRLPLPPAFFPCPCHTRSSPVPAFALGSQVCWGADSVKTAGAFEMSQSTPQLTDDETGAQRGYLTWQVTQLSRGHSPGLFLT